jgi:hypothetical protein
MAKKAYELSASVSTENPQTIKRVLEREARSRRLKTTIQVKAKMVGESARDLNRTLLSVLRKVEKRTRLQAEWAFGNDVERFFDYVPKGAHKK